MQLALLHFELGHIERRSEAFGVCLIFVFHVFLLSFVLLIKVLNVKEL